MILPIVLYGNPVLTKRCNDISVGTNVKELAENMFITMYNAKGVGLAAPQIGKNISMFVADFSCFERKKYGTLKFIAINPKLEFPEDNDILEEEEGCLSIPTISAKVKRYKYVIIKYYDFEWNYHEERYSDWPARVIQHETDHLFQKLYIDNIKKTQEIKQFLEDVKNGLIIPDYLFVHNN